MDGWINERMGGKREEWGREGIWENRWMNGWFEGEGMDGWLEG